MGEGKPYILLVEDDPDIAQLAAERLAGLGREIKSVSDTPAARAAIKERVPALMLLDYMLPGENGLEFVESFKARGEVCPPFIVMTGHSAEEAAVAMLRAGARDYLVKGVSFFDPLKSAVKRVLEELESARRLDASRLALKESEEKLKEAHRLARVGSWDLDAATDTITWSEEYCRLFGLDPAQRPPGYEDHLKLYAPESAARLDAAVKRNMQTGEAYELDLELAGKEGPCRWITARSETKRNAQGRITGLFGTAQDITERKREHDAAVEARDRLDLALSSTGMGSWYLDIKEGKRHFDAQVCRLLGLGPGKFSGNAEEFFDAVHPGDRAELKKQMAMTIEQNAPYRPEYRVVLPGGGLRYISARGRLRRDENGRPWRIDGIIWDITERKLAEEKLRESETRYRTLFDQARDSILLLELPPEGAPVIRDANAAALRMHGYSREEITGKPISFLDAEVQPSSIQELVNRIKTAGSMAFEAKHRRKDGSVFDLEVSVMQLAIGGKHFLIDISRDITGRKQAEAERERLMAAIEQAGDAILISGPDGAIQYVNPAFEKVTGYSRGEVIGKNPRILKSGKQDEAYYRELWGKISSGKTWEGRMMNKRKDGTLYTVEATISPVRDAAGKIISYVAVKKDITERLQLESQYRQAQKMEAVGLLAGGVAHDFNNILTAIKGYCTLVTNTLKPEDPNREDILEIMTAADRAATLTRQLLAFSRKQIMVAQVIDLNKSLGDIVNMLRRIIGEDIRLTTRLFSAPCFAKVDPGQIEQVIMNLTLNARDAIGKGGEITLETEILTPPEDFFSAHSNLARGRLVCVKVRDNGCGMSPGEQKHLFEPFYTTKAPGKGTGLGLPVVFGIVKQSHGEIEVESASGKGSTFSVYLPLAETPPPDESKNGGGKHPAIGHETVLFVEDEYSLRRLGERVLRESGYKVLAASDGQEALKLMEERGEPVDLLITDLVMPGMSGRELGKELARRTLTRRTLYMSGYTDDAISVHGVLEPGVAFIYKPFSVEALSSKMREVLDGPAGQAKA